MAVDGFNENGEIVVPDCVRGALRSLVSQIDGLDEAIGAIDKEIAMSVKADETAKRLMTVPGVGPVTASAIMATIQDMGQRARVRHLPRLDATPELDRRPVTKMGDRYLRKLLVVGACASSAIAKAIMMLCVCGRAGCSSARSSRERCSRPLTS
jgi:transposase